MDGSSLSLIIIPVVVVISLAAWLILVAHAASHPQRKGGPAAPRDARPATLPDGGVPLPRTEIPRPVRQPADQAHGCRRAPRPMSHPAPPCSQMTDAGAADRRQRDCRANR